MIRRKPQLGDHKKPLQSLETHRSINLYSMEIEAMANKLLLTEDELVDLTGYVRTDAQVRWLQRNNWEYVLSGYKRPKVSRTYADQRLGLAIKNELRQTSAPDFSAWGGPSL